MTKPLDSEPRSLEILPPDSVSWSDWIDIMAAHMGTTMDPDLKAMMLAIPAKPKRKTRRSKPRSGE